MANNYFSFKQFTVHHDKCAMKVGTDGVLLGAWVKVINVGRILDIGTGTGLIAIMMAQRSTAFIDAVEIDENACKQAVENVAACPWKERIVIHHDSFQHFAANTTSQYDIIVSNPPYFSNSLKSPLQLRSLARHDDSLSNESLLRSSAHILAPEGYLYVIIPAYDINSFIALAGLHGLYPSQMIKIRPVPHKAYSRCLIEFSSYRNQICTEKELIIKQENSKEYTHEYKNLTRDYYLNF
jgi:tRNA1Val (adenine37-N6)-methyltransferase